MVSELDLLRKDIPRLEQQFGADSLFVEVLKAQLASMENQTKQPTQGEKKRREFGNFKNASSPEEK
ncbi:hypothetical protein [Methylomicrobium sp. Wu6]|uniref:hypothetical protein n=1 Tax=Methylomicrobium sp. Wu6 TaxID=3107928 RepID=UPI002DD68A98|nr:hypothetical protein [Methylomicrobium sp. Wu6]MEC4750386.1 hypothetical protein [Methylomicrobium sp. Wu6]